VEQGRHHLHELFAKEIHGRVEPSRAANL
jgi:hypothetical protein